MKFTSVDGNWFSVCSKIILMMSLFHWLLLIILAMFHANTLVRNSNFFRMYYSSFYLGKSLWCQERYGSATLNTHFKPNTASQSIVALA